MNRRLLPFQGWRLTLFQAVMVAVFILFSLRMYDLQIASYQTYEAAADENRLDVDAILGKKALLLGEPERHDAGGEGGVADGIFCRRCGAEG